MHKIKFIIKVNLVLLLVTIICFSSAVNSTSNICKQTCKGKICYGYKVYPNPDLIISFDLDNPDTLNTIGTPITTDKIAGGTWIEGIWWCCEYSSIGNSKIWVIDHITGDMTLIGESGVGLNGLAYDDTTSKIYACSSTELYSIDMDSGDATLIGAFNINGCVMVGIACDGYGKMYGEDLHTDSLYSIDPMTGISTLIGAFGLDLNYGQDIAFDKETGICYLSAFTVHNGNEGALYTCNLTTGSTTKIGNFGSVPTQITGFAIPYNFNSPPTAPEIEGTVNGKIGVVYNYTFLSSDPDGDDIYYHLSWGDKEIIYIYGPFPSGTKLTLSYNWTEIGTYIITCSTRDIYDEVSEISKLEVTMPRNKIINISFLRDYLKSLPIFEILLTFMKVI
jgi:hypothetical protein